MANGEHKPGLAVADRVREAEGKVRADEDKATTGERMNNQRVNSFLGKIDRELERMKDAEWEEKSEQHIHVNVKTDPSAAPEKPPEPCSEDEKLPGIQYVPKPLRKYVVRAALVGLIALIVGPERAKELINMLPFLTGGEGNTSHENPAEDSGSELTE